MLSVLLAACADREQEISTTFLVSVPTPEAMMYGNLSNEEMQMQQHGSFESESAATSRMTEMTNHPYNYAWTPKVNPTVVEKEKIVEKIVEVKEEVPVTDHETLVALQQAQSQVQTLTGQVNSLNQQVKNLKACTVGNTRLEDKETKTFYTSTSVAFGKTCTPYQRTCRDRDASGPTHAIYQSCETELPKQCRAPSREWIDHGESLRLWDKSNDFYSCSKSYDSVVRYCDNGKWRRYSYSSSTSSFPSGYIYSSCTVTPPKSCYLDGKTVSHNRTSTFYRKDRYYSYYSKKYLTRCVSQRRSCNNGSLGGDSRYKYRSCTRAKNSRTAERGEAEPINFSSLPYQWEDLQAMTQPDQLTAQSFPDTTKCSDWGFWKGKGYKISEYPLNGYRGCKSSCFVTSNRVWDADKGQMVNLGWYNSNPDGKYVFHKDYLKHYSSINAVKTKVDSCMRCEKAKFEKQCTYKKRRYTVVTGTQKIDVLNN